MHDCCFFFSVYISIFFWILAGRARYILSATVDGLRDKLMIFGITVSLAVHM